MKPKRRRKMIMIVCIVIAVIAIGAGGFFAFMTYQINRIPHMSFEDVLTYTTKNNERAVIAVGIIQNGVASHTIYGANGAILPNDKHIYEIGSLTKTFTASLLFKAIDEGKIRLGDSIDTYLDLPEMEYYPTIKRLVTHTSGFERHYFEPQMISNFFHGKNSFYGISKTRLIERIGKINLEDKDYGFKYSNFGVAVVGAVLSEIYGKNYSMLINEFISAELGLNDTKISDGSGDLGRYWDWKDNDAYMAAGALTSTIEDMLLYAQYQLNETPEYLSGTHQALAEINATSGSYAKMNIRMDSIGATWIIDARNNIVWHNGGTGDYNSYLGFDPDKQIAVAVLSNLPPSQRIPATVIGVKLLNDLRSK